MWELDYQESWVLKNWCFWSVVLEKTLESPLDCKEIQPVRPRGDQSWVFIGRTQGDNRGWDVWMASLTQWTWVWVNSGSWWWTRRPGVLWPMGSRRVRHNWATELNWILYQISWDIQIYFPGGSDSKESICNVGDLGWSLCWEDPLEKATPYS